jgi:prepilin-type processing-associated H-X9-DG protein
MPAQQQFWYYFLQPYAKSDQLFYCPSDTVHISGGSAGLSNANVGYGWNFNWLQNKDAAYVATNPGVSIAEIANSAETVMAADNKDTGGGSSYLVNATRYGGVANTSFQPSKRHFEGANFLFCDGHVKYFILPGVILANETLWDLS